MMNDFPWVGTIFGEKIAVRSFFELVIGIIKVISKKFLYYVINNGSDNVMLRISVLIVLVLMSIYFWYLLVSFLIT